MTDQATEKLQNMNIQDYDGSEFDPYSANNMETNQPNRNGFDEDFLNGHDGRHVNFGGDEMQRDDFNDKGDVQAQKERQAMFQRNMSEGEVLGYQTEYGESTISGQMEYGVDSDDEANAHTKRNYGHIDNEYLMQTGQPLVEFDNVVDDVGNNGGNIDYAGGDVQNDYGAVGGYEDNVVGPDDGSYVDDPVNAPEPWHPELDADRSRRSSSPERSVSPNYESQSQSHDMTGAGSSQYDSSPSDVPLPPLPGHSDDSQSAGIPQSDNASVTDSQSVTSHSESDMLSPRPRKKGIPKPKSRKPLELPPWDDNVVIPPPPRMKPTLIGKQADLPPPPPQSPHRIKSAHSRKADGSSDSGVEEDRSSGLKSPRKSSVEGKKKYGTDTQNPRYKPGGGNVQITASQKLDLKSVGPRTDSTTPKSALSARNSPAPSERSITSPKPSPNTANAKSKIGSLNNVKHTPGGGNVQVLSTKVDFSNVKSKVGSKDKIDHKPKGGDKKILDQKVEFKAQSKVGSTANLKHKPGGGDKKIESVKLDFTEKAKPKVGSLDKVTHKPGGGDIKILDEKVDFSQTASPKVGSLDKVKHKPGGGDKVIETQKLNFKETAKPRTDTGVGSGEKARSHDSNSRSASVTSSQDGSFQG